MTDLPMKDVDADDTARRYIREREDRPALTGTTKTEQETP